MSNVWELYGGEDGIRTHEKLLTSTPLAGERLRPLGHLSVPRWIKKSPRTSNKPLTRLLQKSGFAPVCRSKPASG